MGRLGNSGEKRDKQLKTEKVGGKKKTSVNRNFGEKKKKLVLLKNLSIEERKNVY